MKHILAPCLIGLFLLPGCSLLKSPTADVEQQIARMTAAISNKEDANLRKLLHDELVFENHYGRRTKPGRAGLHYFRKSLNVVESGMMGFYTKIEKIKVLSEGRIMAVVEMRMRIRRGAADMNHIAWMTNQIWVKVPTGGGGRPWVLREYVENGPKMDHFGNIYENGTVHHGARKHTPAPKTTRKSSKGGFVGQVTGETPLKVKKRSTDRINKFSANRDKQLAD